MQQNGIKGLWGDNGRPSLGVGPALVPDRALQYTKHGPLCIGYIFAYYATKMGSRDTGDIKVHPHWVWDPPWSFNGPCHGPPIHQTWPFT